MTATHVLALLGGCILGDLMLAWLGRFLFGACDDSHVNVNSKPMGEKPELPSGRVMREGSRPIQTDSRTPFCHKCMTPVGLDAARWKRAQRNALDAVRLMRERGGLDERQAALMGVIYGELRLMEDCMQHRRDELVGTSPVMERMHS